MKTIHTLYIAIALLLFAACSDVKPETQGQEPQALRSLDVENANGNINISWELPGEASAVSIAYNDDAAVTIEKEKNTHAILNPEVNREHFITGKVLYPDSRLSQGVTRRITIEGIAPVSNLKAVRENQDIALTWDLPASNQATQIEIVWNDGGSAQVSGTQTSYTIANTSMNTTYRIGVRTQNSSLKSHYIYVETKSQKIGYFMLAESPEEIVDDDEAASYQWFVNTYAAGEVLTPSTITGTDLSSFGVLWIHVDRVGLLTEAKNLPGELINEQVVSAISTYLKEGGNLLLTNHATSYITMLERLPADRFPGIFGSGEGGSGTDVWSFNTHIGLEYDHKSHPMFATLGTVNDFGFPTIPLIGPGHREDHNCMWDLNAYGYEVDGSNVVDKFQKQYNTQVLGTWGHVSDYCCAGIVEFYPTNEIRGRCIAIGLAAYEWNQNSNPNIYQQNIEVLTANTIEYLQNN